MRFLIGLLAIVVACAAPTAVASEGCGAAPPPLPPDFVAWGEGQRRDLIVALPPAYDPARQYRLVIAFHGRTNDAARVRGYYGLEEADDGRSIFVYPQATRQADGTFIWRRPADVEMVAALIDGMARHYCIARDRVFVVGHSLGASFANTVACLRGDLLRGVASVAGSIAAQDCRGDVAALLVHHPQDRLVPMAQGRKALNRLLTQNALAPHPAPGPDWFRYCSWYGPRDGANPVVWCLHDSTVTRSGRHYPHQWPPQTAEAVMEFFEGLPE